MKALAILALITSAVVVAYPFYQDGLKRQAHEEERREIKMICCSIPRAEEGDNRALWVEPTNDGRTSWLVCRKGDQPWNWTETVRIPGRGRFYFPAQTAEDGMLLVGGVQHRWSLDEVDSGACGDEHYVVDRLITAPVKKDGSNLVPAPATN